MGQAIHSPFLQALGYAIINSLWQFALLWLAYVCINTVFKLSSHKKYFAGLVLELAGFFWFAVTLAFYCHQSSLLAQNFQFLQQSFSESILTNTAITGKQRFFLWVLQTEQFLPYLSIAYLALLIFLCLKWFYAYRYTQTVRTKGVSKIEVDWRLFVQKLSSQLGIKRVTIFLSEIVQTPLTIGFLKPLILIPVACINHLNTDQMEAVILHELAHIKRYDYLFNLFLALIETSLFFNPFMQLISAQIKRERENCCDDWVLQYQYNAASYASALLKIASYQSYSPLLALKATDNKHLLLKRIKRLIEKKESSFFNYKHQLLALFVMTIVFSSFAILSSINAKSTKIASSSPKSVVFQPLAARVDNPLFNPVFFLADTPKIIVNQKKNDCSGSLKVALSPRYVKNVTERAGEDEKQRTSSASPNDNFTPANENQVLITNTTGQQEDLQIEAERQTNKFRMERFETDKIAEENELAEAQLRQVDTSWIKEGKQALNPQKLKEEMDKALKHLKSAKSELKVIRIKNLVQASIKELKKSKIPLEIAKLNSEKLNDLVLLTKQIEEELDESKQQGPFLETSENNFNLTFDLSPVIYPLPQEEKAHSFSYEYSEKPKVKVFVRQTCSKCIKNAAERRRNKSILATEDEDETKQINVPLPPPEPMIRFKKLRLIKI